MEKSNQSENAQRAAARKVCKNLFTNLENLLIRVIHGEGPVSDVRHKKISKDLIDDIFCIECPCLRLTHGPADNRRKDFVYMIPFNGDEGLVSDYTTGGPLTDEMLCI